MRKIILALALSGSFAVAACGSTKPVDTTTSNTTVQNTADGTVTTTDSKTTTNQ